MITEGQPRTFARQVAFGRSPFAIASLVLGGILALVFGLLGSHSFAANTGPDATAMITPTVAATQQSDQLVAGSALHAELLSGPQTACEQPCLLPSPAPAQDDATLLMLCALAMLVTLALLVPPALRRVRSRSSGNAFRSAALALRDTNRAPSPPGIHCLSVCRT